MSWATAGQGGLPVGSSFRATGMNVQAVGTGCQAAGSSYR
jgi:hypothetical protein